MKKIYVLIAAIIISFGLSAQDISLSIEKKSIDELQKGDKVLIGVFVQNQSKPIAGFQLYVEYDSIVLTYSNVLNKYSAFSNEWISNDNGYFFAANWLTLDPKGLNFKGREKLFDLEFTYHGGET
ncbi:MAG: hypothetical protein K8S16_01095, partial [Bacteroidales bacterium]|nr:hypothetical protein [Bacteroidales bacterium]